MMQNISFVRKMIYIGCIALLILPLSLIAVPSTRDRENEVERPGGVLAQLRDKHRLSQATLGDVDPASESMKLGTLGLRPFAVSMLWSQVNEFNKTRNWDRRTATLNQLMKIQPNFIKIWEFQAHNLAFNTAREFDDYEDRYVWVKKGINFLISGIGYFRYDHRMTDNIGYLFSLKVGQSDEKTQFRRLLRKDTEFHDQLSAGKMIDIDKAQGWGGPDNWLIARLWYLKSESMVENQGLPLRTSGQVIFYLNAPKQRRNYARDYEIDFEPDEGARIAWENAYDDWIAFGNRQLRSTKGLRIQLRGVDAENRKIVEWRKKLDELVPGVRERLAEEIKNQRTPEEQAAMDSRGPKQPLDEQVLAKTVELREIVKDEVVAAEADDSRQSEADRIVSAINRHLANLSVIETYRDLSNYAYWETRCESETTDNVLEARKALYRARKQTESNVFISEEKIDEETGEKTLILGSIDEYEKCFQAWAEVFKTYPSLENETFTDDLEEACLVYLRQIQGPAAWPQDFPLQYIIDRRAEIMPSDLPTSEQLKLYRRKKPDTNRETNPAEKEQQSDAPDKSGAGEEKS